MFRPQIQVPLCTSGAGWHPLNIYPSTVLCYGHTGCGECMDLGVGTPRFEAPLSVAICVIWASAAASPGLRSRKAWHARSPALPLHSSE